MTSEAFTPETPPKAKGGRPKGSKNKAKTQTKAAAPAVQAPEPQKPAISALEAAKARRDAARSKKRNTNAMDGQVLVASERESYDRRWVNDSPARMQQMLDKGWMPVEDGSPGSESINSSDPGSGKSNIVGTTSEGSAQRAVLMEVPKEWREQDQQEKAANIIDVEDSTLNLTRDGDKGIGAPGSHAYVPEGESRFKPE